MFLLEETGERIFYSLSFRLTVCVGRHSLEAFKNCGLCGSYQLWSRDINFDPLVLPAGMAPSNDPLLSARSAVYSQSFTRRAGETKEPSEITPSEVRK